MREASSNPRVLVVSIADPRASTSGASTVTRALLHLLERPPLNASIQCVSQPLDLVRGRRLHQAASLARSLFTSRPSKIEFAYSRRYREAVRRCFRSERFELVVINGADLLWLLDEIPAATPRMLIAHNIEHLLFASQMDSMRGLSAPLRRLLERDHGRLQRFETAGMRAVRNVLFLSDADAEYAVARCPDLHLLVTPPIFVHPTGTRRVARVSGQPIEIGLIGNFNWWPNRDGLRWFLEKVYPRLKPGRLHLHLFGLRSEEWGAFRGVTAHGFLPDVAAVWARCEFMISPVVSGGGVSVKTAEAILNRVPVLATSFALRGLPRVEDPAVVVLDGSDAWARFLGSSSAEALAAQCVSPEVAAYFAAARYENAVQNYVASVLSQGVPFQRELP